MFVQGYRRHGEYQVYRVPPTTNEKLV
jgi:hypothetical protein